MRGTHRAIGLALRSRRARAAASTRAVVGIAITVIATACGPATPSAQPDPSARTDPPVSGSQFARSRDPAPPSTAGAWTVVAPAIDQPGGRWDLVAIGPEGYAATSSGDRPGLWTSPDAATWTRTGNPDLGGVIRDLVADQRGDFIATGDGPNGGAMFVRFDKVNARVSIPEKSSSLAAAVVPNGSGYLAVGGTLDGVITSLIWSSADGRTWDRTAGPPGTIFEKVAAGPGGWIAVANRSLAEVGDAQAEFWLSNDARTWRRGSSIENATVSALVAVEGGVIAVGRASTGQPDLFPAIWRSADGQSWTPIERRDVDGLLSDIVEWRGGLVAVGSAIGGSGGGLIWTSTDGSSWSEATGIDLDGMRLNDAATWNGKLAIVGELRDGPLVILSDAPR